MDLPSIDKLLTTTRAVRKRLDFTRPVEPEVIHQCLDIATRAPTGGGICRYAFVVVTDPAKRQGMADLYRKAFSTHFPPDRLQEIRQRQPRDVESWVYLAEHLHEVPVHIIPCIEGRVEDGTPFQQATIYGSILPAAWSLMLALRARGVGAAWTTLHVMYEAEAATLLGIPAGVTQGALLPVAYFTGNDFTPATRVPARERTFWDTWGQAR